MLGTMDCHGLTDAGLVRRNNEDQFLIADLRKSVTIHHTSLSYDEETELHGGSQAKLLLVADGVGGSAAGERASSLALEGVVQYLLNAMHWLFRVDSDRDDEFFRDLKSALSWSQEKIQHAAEANPQQAGMGTTLTMAYLVWPRAYFVHVGDTRAYLYRGSDLVQLTHDQTIAQMLADAGVISAEEVDDHPFHHVLGSLLGCDVNQLEPAVYKTELRYGDQLLLCTDGLPRHVDDERIVQILSSAGNSERACQELIAAANEGGGSDNITAVLARFSESSTDSDFAAEAAAEAGLSGTMETQ